MNLVQRTLPALVVMATALSAQAGIVTISKSSASPIEIPGVAAYQVTGAMMSGMTVTATFTSGVSELRAWAATGPNSGGVTGTGWGLSTSGDTFGATWNFVFAPGAGRQLHSLILDGVPGLTLFDTANPAPGTDGSENGSDFVFKAGTCDACVADVEYLNPIQIGQATPVGDLFHRMSITFKDDLSGNFTGPRSDWSFGQDTDSDIRSGNGVPTPGSLALTGLALVALGTARRRQRGA